MRMQRVLLYMSNGVCGLKTIQRACTGLVRLVPTTASPSYNGPKKTCQKGNDQKKKKNGFICVFSDYEYVRLLRVIVSSVPLSCVNIQRISFSASLINHNVNRDKFFLIYLLIDLFLSSRCYLLFYAHTV